jgi:hypothetical protein
MTPDLTSGSKTPRERSGEELKLLPSEAVAYKGLARKESEWMSWFLASLRLELESLGGLGTPEFGSVAGVELESELERRRIRPSDLILSATASFLAYCRGSPR